jgi:peptidoglycan endopeptidase LytE
MEPAPIKLTPVPQPSETMHAPPVETKEYVIAKNDLLANIAKANHITVGDLMKANPGIEPRRLKVGQKIQIPSAPAPTASAAASGIGFAEPKAETGTGSETLYVIKSGDTLTKIARQHSVTVKAIKTVNDLKTDQILVGKRLKIPAGSASGASASGGGGLSLTNPAGVTTVR